MFCPNCGSELPENAKVCGKCKNPVGDVPNDQASTQAPPAQNPPEPKSFSFTASNISGEAVLGSLGGGVTGAVSNVIPGPGKVIVSSVKSFFTSIGTALKEPKRLIPTVVLAAVWLILNILQACGINPIPTRIISFFTFANGGMSGGFFGTVGGIIGKGIFAGAAASLIGLFTRKGGEKGSVTETFKGTLGVSFDTVFAYLTGIGAAMLLYLFISGGATRMSFMGGIAAAYLSARAALNNGFLKNLLGSFTSKGKASAGPNVQEIIRGLAVGFAAAAFIGLLRLNLILIIAGVVLLVGGIVMMILQATGVVKLGKGAQAQ